MPNGAPIVLTDKGIPVTFAENAVPVVVSDNGLGTPVTPVESGGAPMTLVGQPTPPPVNPVSLPYVFETNTLNGYSLNFTSLTGYGFVRVVALKTGASANLTATLDGNPWVPVSIVEEASGVVVAIWAANNQGVGAHTVAFAGNVSYAAGRFGDVLQFDSIIQEASEVQPEQYYWEVVLSGVASTSDVTMVAGSAADIATPISGDGVQQGQSYIPAGPLAAWFSHVPSQSHGGDYYVAYPNQPAMGAMAAVEVANLKPLILDLQGTQNVGSATVTRLGNGNYRIVAGYDSSGRFRWPFGQLLGGQVYDLSFTVVSISGGSAVFDWCDGNEASPAATPASPIPLSVGAWTIQVSRPSYDNTFRFMDISNGDDEEDGTTVTIEITPPVVSANLVAAQTLARWDAERPDLITRAGSAVTTWADANNGYAPTQAVGGSKPAWNATSFNGRPGVTFDGGDDWLLLATSSIASGAVEMELTILAEQLSLGADATDRYLLSVGGAASPNNQIRAMRQSAAGVNRAGNRGGNGVTNDAVVNTGIDFSGLHVIRCQFRQADPEMRVSIDGNAFATSGSITPATNGTAISLGASLGGGGLFNGRIAVAIITSLLTDAQAAWLTAYLKTRGGVA